MSFGLYVPGIYLMPQWRPTMRGSPAASSRLRRRTQRRGPPGQVRPPPSTPRCPQPLPGPTPDRWAAAPVVVHIARVALRCYRSLEVAMSRSGPAAVALASDQ